MKGNSTTLSFIIITLAISTTFSNFIDPKIRTENFLTDTFLLTNYSIQKEKIGIIFKEHFKFDFIGLEEFPLKLSHIILRSDDAVFHGVDELDDAGLDDIQCAIGDKLNQILWMYRDTIRSQLSDVTNKPNGGTDKLAHALKEYFSAQAAYYLKVSITEQIYKNYGQKSISEGSTNIDSETLAKQVLGKLIDMTVIDEAISKLLDKENLSEVYGRNLKAFILKNQEEYFIIKLRYIKNVIEFRENYEGMLFKVLKMIFEGINSGEYIIDDDTYLIINDVLNAISEVYITTVNKNPENFFYQFATTLLIPSKSVLTRKYFEKLINVTLSILSNRLVESNIQNLLGILLNYALGSNYVLPTVIHRTPLLALKYKRESITYDPKSLEYKFGKDIIQLYIIDLLLNQRVNKLEMSNSDFHNIVKNWQLLEEFPVARLGLLADLDRFFSNKAFGLSKPEFFNTLHISLYNLFLTLTVEYVRPSSIENLVLSEVLDSFMQFALITKLEVRQFKFNIVENYIYFKLLHMYADIDYFVKTDNEFLAFDKVIQLNAELRDVLFPKLLELIRAWKHNEHNHTNKLNDENFFSGVTISKGVMTTFYNSNWGDINEFAFEKFIV